MKHIAALFLALFATLAQAQTYTPADCAVSVRNDNGAQGLMYARVGAPLVTKTADFSWSMATAHTIPMTPFTSARVVFPTAGTGSGIAGSGTVYLTVVPSTSGANTCAGYGAGFQFLAPPTINRRTGQPSTDTILAATLVTPLQTGDLTFTLSPAALAYVQSMAGESVVFGVSMLVPRITIYPVGEDPKKTNQPGAIVDFWRQVACSPTQRAYCPTLVTQ